MGKTLRSFKTVFSLLVFVGYLGLASYGVADDKLFIDFSEDNYQRKGSNDAVVESHTTPEGKATIKVVCPAGKNYPGVTLLPKEGVWDMSKYAYVAAMIHNPGKEKLTVMMRVDNKGDWKKKPWNSEKWGIPPGKSQFIRVWFGYSRAKKGYPLDASKVSAILLFTGKQKEDKEFLVEEIVVGGKPGDISDATMRQTSIRPKGDLLGLDKTDGPKMLSADRGIKAVSGKTSDGKSAVKLSFPADNKSKRPSAFIQSEKGQTWNLTEYSGVKFTVSNPGSKPVKVYFRLDNNNARDRKNSVGIERVIAPGLKTEIPLSFVNDVVIDIGDKKNGFSFSSDKVRGISIFADSNSNGGELLIEHVVGMKEAAKKLPEWLGKRPPVEGNWEVTFDDNFDGDTVDTKKWRLPVKIGDEEKEGRTARSVWGKPTILRPENAVVKDGKLSMIVEMIPEGTKFEHPKYQDCKYYSTAPTTFDRFAQKYGYFEARMKLPTVAGQWPAFWLMPDRGKEAGIWWKRQNTANGGMEFDIMEYLTRYGPYCYHGAMHWDGYKKNHKAIGSSSIFFLPDEEGYVTSGLLWEPGKATFYVNGRKVAVWENERVCSVPAYIILTNAIGGWGDVFIDEKGFPDKFVVDYVRVWQRDDLKGK